MSMGKNRMGLTSYDQFIYYGYKWATSWENLLLQYTNNKGADQPAHPRSLISAFVVRCLDSIIPLVSSLYLASVSVCSWSDWFESYLVANPEDRVSRDEAQIVFVFLASNEAPFENWAASSEFVSSSIPSWKHLTAHAQPFRGARYLAFCLKVPLDSLLVWASSGGSAQDCADAQARLNLRCSHKR